jgi:hypothetical protein
MSLLDLCVALDDPVDDRRQVRLDDARLRAERTGHLSGRAANAAR